MPTGYRLSEQPFIQRHTGQHTGNGNFYRRGNLSKPSTLNKLHRLKETCQEQQGGPWNGRRMRKSLRNPFSLPLPFPARRKLNILAVSHRRAARINNSDTEVEHVSVHYRCVSAVHNEAEKWLHPRPSPQPTFVLKAAAPPSGAVLSKRTNESRSIRQVQFGFTYSSDNVVCYTLPAIWLRARREDKRPEYKENLTTHISPSIFHLLADPPL